MTVRLGVDDLGRAAAVGSGARATSPARRTAVLVTGMHRNGTSALARTLSLLGAAMPADLVPPNEGNPHGHWEPRGMVDLNDRMLAEAGSDLYGVADIPPAWFDSPAALAFTAEAAELIEGSFGDESLVVLKDPRTALLAPIWNRALADRGYRVVHILPLRHPVDVARSLRRRHLKTIPYDAWVSPRGEAVWLRYTLAAVRGSRGHGRAFLRYGALLDDWRRELGRVGRELGLDWPKGGIAVEAEVDAFLHGNDQADGDHAAVDADVRDLRALDMVQLAGACFAELEAHGDDGARVDAIHAAFTSRIEGARDLVTTLEGLYPLVWRYFEASETTRLQRDAATAAEARLRADGQQTWAALTRANNDKLRLTLDLGSQDRRGVGLDGEVARLEQRAAGAEAQAGILRDDIVRLGAELAEARADLLPRVAAIAGERDRIAEAARQDRAAMEGRIAAIESSTSWRVTAPLRALSRAIRGRR